MPSVQPRTRYTAAPSPPSKTVSGDAHRIPGERRIYACRPKTARRSPSSPRARRAASCLQLDDRLDGRALESNLVDALEERELVLDALVFEHHHHVLASDRALQLLPVELVSLDLVPRAFLPREGLGALAVAAAEARRDQIGQPAALHESLVLDALEEHLGELHRLLEADPDDRRLRVAAEPETVREARAQGDDVLERTAQLGAGDVGARRHGEVGRVEELAPLEALGRVRAADRRLSEVALGHLVRHVGAHQHRHGHVPIAGDALLHLRLQKVRDEDGLELAALLELDALDERDADRVLRERALHLRHDRREEVVRDDEDHHRRARHALLDIGARDNVRRERDARQVDDVLVLLVDHLGQRLVALVHPRLALGWLGAARRAHPLAVLKLDVLLKHPHHHLVIEIGALRGVDTHLGGDGGAPVARTDECDLLRHG
mmetsp:Transcript_26239/g.69568  ORF Transcript_26239/g.69568 Transcript_26239/m.69568 type:complete len:435 (-) Transcript_26239:82-1386(-)